MKIHKKSLLAAIGAAFAPLSANAVVIFNADTTNSGIVDNNFATTPSNSFTGTTGALVVTTTAASNNHMSGIASNDDIDTLKGSALLSTDTVTMTITVSSTDHNLRANGFEFGMSPAAPVVGDDSDISDFRPLNNLLIQIDDGGTTSGMAINGITAFTPNEAGWGATETSLIDGFTVTLVADSAGFNFTLTDIEEAGNLTNTTLSFGGAFSGTEFIDNFGGGHIYYALQGTSPGGTVNISEFSIDVTPVPEPSSTALLGLGGLALILRRRK